MLKSESEKLTVSELCFLEASLIPDYATEDEAYGVYDVLRTVDLITIVFLSMLPNNAVYDFSLGDYSYYLCNEGYTTILYIVRG